MTKEEIKELRQKLKMSQVDFATKIGVRQLSICRWENGKASPSPLAIEKLKRLIDEYKCES